MFAVGDPVAAGLHGPRFTMTGPLRGCSLAASTGAGEAYMDGQWSSPDLRGVLSGALANAQRVRLDAAMSLPRRLCDLWRNTRRRNTRSGSEQNIQAHYDLGNEFFRLFLDESLAYSCAIWDGCDDLGEAQQAKFDLVCRKLDLEPGDRVLEIGCGWGGFAIHAAQATGCHVVGITVSREQHRLASRRVAAAGLDDRVQIVYSDYRDVDGMFDKVVSIEMFEAVGREYWDEFFATCERVLRPGGAMLLQTIGIQDRDAASGMRASGWISKYIFPGGVLPRWSRFGNRCGAVGRPSRCGQSRRSGRTTCAPSMNGDVGSGGPKGECDRSGSTTGLFGCGTSISRPVPRVLRRRPSATFRC